MDEHSKNSSFREKLIEHLFIGEILKLSWINKDFTLEVSKPEVDNSGYDIIIESKDIMRHIQLKAAFIGAKTSRQNIHISLGLKQSGCMVWIYFDKESLDLGPFLFFGGEPGEPLPDLNYLKIAKHTKANSIGNKTERANIRVINKGSFTTFGTLEELYHALFTKK